MSDLPTRNEICDAVDRAVKDLLDEAGIHEPPVDVALLVRHLGLPPVADPRRGRAGVVAKVARTAASEAWLGAHAIGERLRPDILRRLGLAPDQALGGESLPNLLADRLMVPTRWLSALGRECGWDLLELGERFRPAGHEAIAWRMLDLAEPVAITVVDGGRVTRRRSNALRVGKTLSGPEERCHQTAQRDGKPCEAREAGWLVQCWPLHEGREILRSRREED